MDRKAATAVAANPCRRLAAQTAPPSFQGAEQEATLKQTRHQPQVTLPRRGSLLAGMMVGGLAALGALLAALTLRATFVAVETIERTLGLPVLAALPAVPAIQHAS